MNRRDQNTLKIIEAEMREFASHYGLPFRGIRPLYRKRGQKGLYGICHPDGFISLRVRWDSGRPLQAYAVVDTMAHELAHLKHMHHSSRWFDLHVTILRSISKASTIYETLKRRLK